MALMMAAWNGGIETVRFLLAAGADTNLQDNVSANIDITYKDFKYRAFISL